MYEKSKKVLHNFSETAPETWDGGIYDEKSDVFSFAVIMWRLFASSQQCDNENNTDDYAFLKKDGKWLPTPVQREVIGKVSQ